MGIGFQIVSDPWRPRFWGKPSVDKLAQTVRVVFTNRLRDPLLVDRLSIETEGQVVVVAFHPIGDPLLVELRADGRLQASASTSSVGPGYHTFLIAILDDLAQALKVSWDFAQEGADEAGYASTRDFAALRREMAAWLRAVCNVTLQDDAEQNGAFRLSMNVDGPRPQLAVHAYSSTGTWSRETFERAVADDQALIELSRAFFAWWSDGMDAAFFVGMARVVAWVDFPWVSPRDEAEVKLANFVLGCFERARQLEPGLEPPVEVLALRALLDAGDVQVPAPDGVGYRRHECAHSLFAPWMLELPGYFAMVAVNDGSSLQFEAGQRAVFVSAFDMQQGEDMPSAGAILKSVQQTRPPDFEWSSGHVLGTASFQEDGEYVHLHAIVAVHGKALSLTITNIASAARDWAEQVARSVTYPEPR